MSTRRQGAIRTQSMTRRGQNLRMLAALAVLFAVLVASAAMAVEGQRVFKSADAAVQALVAAARANDSAALVRILGPASTLVVSSGDPVADRQARERFIEAYDAGAKLTEGAKEVQLLVGADEWPFPIPVVKAQRGWRFDTAKGEVELLRRRIGQNELSAIEVCRAYVDAQREYAERDREGDGLVKYAQRFASEPGKRNGLYWEAAAGEEPSPLGQLVVRAQGAGYSPGKGSTPTPYYGYYYRILTAQGPHAKGGAAGYVVQGRMIGGFAMVAWPAKYASSGVMTFIVNHDGVVYQKDLGRNTAAIAKKMTAFDPDQTWRPVE